MARWFEQAVKIPSFINVIYSLQHFSYSKGNNKANSIDFDRLLQLILHKTPHVCSVSNRKLTNYDVTKSSSDNFPDVSTSRSVCKAKKKGHFQSRTSRRYFNEMM